jgi:hypothetical protein
VRGEGRRARGEERKVKMAIFFKKFLFKLQKKRKGD